MVSAVDNFKSQNFKLKIIYLILGLDIIAKVDWAN